MEADLNELNRLKQDKIIELRDLDTKITDKTRSVDKLESAKEELEPELKEIRSYKAQATKEYQGLLASIKEASSDLELAKINLKEFRRGKVDMDKDVNTERSKKQQVLNQFKKSKQDFIDRLNDRDKILRAEKHKLNRDLRELAKEQARVADKGIIFEKGIKSLAKSKDRVERANIRLNATQGQLDSNKSESKADMDRIREVKTEKEQELKKQKELTNIVSTQEKVLNSKIETQDKREKLLSKRRGLITKEKKALDTLLGRFDNIKKDKIAQIKRTEVEIKAKDKELQQARGIIETTEQEISKAKDRQTAEEQEIKRIIVLKSIADKEIRDAHKELNRLSLNKVKIFREVEAETIKKDEDFKEFHNKKTAILKRISSQEKEIERKEKKSEQISQGLEQRESLLQDGLKIIEAKEDSVERQKIELDKLESTLIEDRKTIDIELKWADKAKKEALQWAKKQRKVYKDLDKRHKILGMRIEIQDKRAKEVTKEKQRLKNFEIKLLDGQKTQQRAWSEIKRRS